MSKVKYIIPAIAIFLASGCTQTVFHKSIEVTKDKNGNVIQTVVTEGVSQPGQTWAVEFEHMEK